MICRFFVHVLKPVAGTYSDFVGMARGINSFGLSAEVCSVITEKRVLIVRPAGRDLLPGLLA